MCFFPKLLGNLRYVPPLGNRSLSAWACQGCILAMQLLLEHFCKQDCSMLKTLVWCQNKLLLILINVKLAGAKLTFTPIRLQCSKPWMHSYMLPASPSSVEVSLWLWKTLFNRGFQSKYWQKHLSLGLSQCLTGRFWNLSFMWKMFYRVMCNAGPKFHT